MTVVIVSVLRRSKIHILLKRRRMSKWTNAATIQLQFPQIVDFEKIWDIAYNYGYEAGRYDTRHEDDGLSYIDDHIG